MAVLCTEGNQSATEVLYDLEWADAVVLAEKVSKLTTEREQREADLHKAMAEAQIKQMGEVTKAVGNLAQSLNRALRG